MSTKSRMALPIIFLLVFPFATDCARNPVTGKRQIALISEQQEIAYGREAHPEVLAEFGRVEDGELQNYLDRIGQELAGVSHRPELEWHFTVVDAPVINAFALPGGYIYFTREILGYMNNEAELAGVLGHEIGHVTARHSVKQISRAQLFSLGLGLGSVISPTFAQFGELAQAGVGLLFLKYGRDDERQSDELGIEYMSKVGYDPRELSDFFQVFQGLQERTDQSLPGWLSTHPAPPERIENTAELARQAISQNPAKEWRTARDTFLQRINGIVFGENPREGFADDGWFLHPDLKFRFRFPDGWRVQNSKRSVVVFPQNQEAAIQLTLARAPKGTSPEDFARNIAQQPNTRMVDGRRTQINGNPAFVGVYELRDPQGNSLGALAGFISYQGNLYQLVGMSPAQLFGRYRSVFEQSLNSFTELTDGNALDVQPDRLRLRQVRQGETLQAIAEALSNPRVKVEDLALLNRVDPDQPLPAGSTIKVIEPGRR